MQVAVAQRHEDLFPRLRFPPHPGILRSLPGHVFPRRRGRQPARLDRPVRHDDGFDMGERLGEGPLRAIEVLKDHG